MKEPRLPQSAAVEEDGAAVIADVVEELPEVLDLRIYLRKFMFDTDPDAEVREKGFSKMHLMTRGTLLCCLLDPRSKMLLDNLKFGPITCCHCIYIYGE
jgi:hypothetical protein